MDPKNALDMAERFARVSPQHKLRIVLVSLVVVLAVEIDKGLRRRKGTEATANGGKD